MIKNFYFYFYLIFINICLMNNTLLENTGCFARDFLMSYFQTIRGNEYTLDKDCLCGKFNDMIMELLADIEQRNFIMVAETLHSIITLEMKMCPVEDFKEILKDLKISMKNGSSFTNTLKNFYFINEKFNEYRNSDESLVALGNFIGKLTKVILYGDVREIQLDNYNMHFLG